jgi:hypothetical protein
VRLIEVAYAGLSLVVNGNDWATTTWRARQTRNHFRRRRLMKKGFHDDSVSSVQFFTTGAEISSTTINALIDPTRPNTN